MLLHNSSTHPRSLYNIFHMPAIIILLLCLVPGCGGGSSGGGSSSPTVSDSSTNTADEPDDGSRADDNQPATSLNMIIDSEFNFSSEREVTISISAANVFGEPLAHKVVSIYTTKQTTTHDLETTDVVDEKFYQGLTDSNGKLSVNLMLANHIEQLNIQISAIGIENSKFISLTPLNEITFN
ncbi:MAG: hypothetical protein COB04_05820 [Gammaproteobacteria bacterium]|nr:MAG: hypothetical protein COB04_05820 [Gammaproteobacteria bacterium]